MRRPLALSLIVLGLVVTLIGGTGLFAPFTDRATSGPNSVTTGERPRAADLKLAWAVASFSSCDTATYIDNATSDMISVDAQPGYDNYTFFCLRNAGSAPLSLTLSVIDRTDDDIDCTGDEAAAGDLQCGVATGGGEAGDVLFAKHVRLDCTTGSGPVPSDLGFLNLDPTAPLGTLAAGATWCGQIELLYPNNVPLEQQLISQTDKVSWKYAFDGTT